MLRDAFAAELFRLTKDRGALFWGFLFVPILALAIGLGTEAFSNAARPETAIDVPADLARQTLAAFAQAASPVTGFFVLLGAAMIFAGDYRHETWRLLTPRASRTDLMLAKFGVFVGLTKGSVLLIGLAGVLAALFGALIFGRSAEWSLGFGGFATQWVGYFAISVLQLLQIGALAALCAVATRSLLAAVALPIGIGVAQAFVQSQFGPTDPTAVEFWHFAALPGLDGEILRAFVEGREFMGGRGIDPAAAGAAFAGLMAWVLVPAGLALALFDRQDLARE